MIRDTEGRTGHEAAVEMFTYENCDECGEGAGGHQPIPLLGNWFLRCNTPEDRGDLRTRRALRDWEREQVAEMAKARRPRSEVIE